MTTIHGRVHTPKPARRALVALSLVFASAAALPSMTLAQTCAGPAWSLRTPFGADTPGARSGAAMAFDTVRGKLVLFGGLGTTVATGDTWEWDATDSSPNWSLRSSGNDSTPAPRYWHAMTFDIGRARVVMTGGTGGGATVFGDTWEWDGTTWALRSTAGPSPRYQHALAYDGSRARTVLVGGFAGGGNIFGDTWEWTGTSWSLRSTGGPAARYGHALAFDSARNRTVLFGGRNAGGSFGDTWEWSGTSWSMRSSTGPVARRSLALGYDASRARTVLFGGQDANSGSLGDTWEWDGSGAGAWTQRPIAGPSPRAFHAMAYDRGQGAILTFGGFDGMVQGDLWTLRVADAPAVTAPPASASVTAGQTATFSVTATGPALAYRWRKNGAALSDGGRISGATTATLSISGVQVSDAGGYSVAVSNTCGTAISRPGSLTIAGCAPDFNSDGAVNVQDFLVFLGAYSAGQARCDLNGDGQVNVTDFLRFLSLYAAGC